MIGLAAAGSHHSRGQGQADAPVIIAIIVTPIPEAPITATRLAAADAATQLWVDFRAASDASLAFAFADSRSVDSGANDVRVACAWLAGPRAPEAWYLGNAYRTLALEQSESQGGDIADAARRIYANLIADVRGSSHPYLLRIWNYLGAINAGDGDGERYRRFCVGRAAAVDAAFNDPPPAATAIGHDGDAGTLQLIALCSRTPAIALENPRQTPAWNYPRDYGPVAPGFSRGALLGADGDAPRLLASGTASIVGHVSQHIGDVAEQLRESLRNLEALLAVGNERSGRAFALAGCEALRVYIRRAGDLPIAQAVIDASGLPRERVLYLRGDVCRRELDVELEGVFAPE
jgi:chorismate lyase/3-hydroxybenzoate synthase